MLAGVEDFDRTTVRMVFVVFNGNGLRTIDDCFYMFISAHFFTNIFVAVFPPHLFDCSMPRHNNVLRLVCRRACTLCSPPPSVMASSSYSLALAPGGCSPPRAPPQGMWPPTGTAVRPLFCMWRHMTTRTESHGHTLFHRKCSKVHKFPQIVINYPKCSADLHRMCCGFLCGMIKVLHIKETIHS